MTFFNLVIIYLFSAVRLFSQFLIDFFSGESNRIISVWRVAVAIESGVVCVHDKVEVAAG